MSHLLTRIRLLDQIGDNVRSEMTRFHAFARRPHRDYDKSGPTVLYITADDKVFGFGHNSEGQLGLGNGRPVWETREVIELRQMLIKEFFIGDDFVLALSGDRKLYSWGDNSVGQLGRGFIR